MSSGISPASRRSTTSSNSGPNSSPMSRPMRRAQTVPAAPLRAHHGHPRDEAGQVVTAAARTDHRSAALDAALENADPPAAAVAAVLIDGHGLPALFLPDTGDAVPV